MNSCHNAGGTPVSLKNCTDACPSVNHTWTAFYLQLNQSVGTVCKFKYVVNFSDTADVEILYSECSEQRFYVCKNLTGLFEVRKGNWNASQSSTCNTTGFNISKVEYLQPHLPGSFWWNQNASASTKQYKADSLFSTSWLQDSNFRCGAFNKSAGYYYRFCNATLDSLCELNSTTANFTGPCEPESLPTGTSENLFSMSTIKQQSQPFDTQHVRSDANGETKPIGVGTIVGVTIAVCFTVFGMVFAAACYIKRKKSGLNTKQRQPLTERRQANGGFEDSLTPQASQLTGNIIYDDVPDESSRSSLSERTHKQVMTGAYDDVPEESSCNQSNADLSLKLKRNSGHAQSAKTSRRFATHGKENKENDEDRKENETHPQLDCTYAQVNKPHNTLKNFYVNDKTCSAEVYNATAVKANTCSKTGHVYDRMDSFKNYDAQECDNASSRGRSHFQQGTDDYVYFQHKINDDTA